VRLTGNLIANATEEYLVRKRPLYEVVGQLGMWGVPSVASKRPPSNTKKNEGGDMERGKIVCNPAFVYGSRAHKGLL